MHNRYHRNENLTNLGKVCRSRAGERVWDRDREKEEKEEEEKEERKGEDKDK